jgi:ketopantoate reductase
MEKNILVVGAGGRTGTLFAQELKNAASIMCVGRGIVVRKIGKGGIFVLREGSSPLRFSCNTISEDDFNEKIKADFIFLATKNPVAPSVRYYYGRVDPAHIPDLILSQNGFLAADEAMSELERMFGALAKKIRIIRIVLFNTVSGQNVGSELTISYSLPLRLAFGIAYGPDEGKDLEGIFDKAKIEAYAVPSGEIKNMEFSKLFINLIGVASYAHGMSIEDGFNDKSVFYDEISVLREFINVVRKNNGKFLNFKHYPVKFFAFVIDKTPLNLLSIFRRLIAKIIAKERRGKSKGNIDEIGYYNGAVIRLGDELGVATTVNKKIYITIKGTP